MHHSPFSAFAACSIAILVSSVVRADNSWGDYHWARQSNPVPITVINSTTDDWDPYVTQAVSDWSSGSSVLTLVEDTSGKTSRKVRRQCKAPDGMIRICNLDYGLTGWLGVAGISADGGSHILRGYSKLNDSYFSMDYYNTHAWKQSVTCQELGHDFGLGHQDEDFATLLMSCMDYQNPPFEAPNHHDYDQLLEIYAHLDTYNTYASGEESGGESSTCNSPIGKGCNKATPPDSNRDIGWGVSLGRRGQSEVFVRIDPDGTQHLTHVLWADQEHAH